MSPLAFRAATQVQLEVWRMEAAAKRYVSAVESLRRALLGTRRAAKWRATVLACDAEHDLIGDCEGPCGGVYGRLGIHDCYEAPERVEDLCAARNPDDEFCRTGCALVQLRTKRKSPTE